MSDTIASLTAVVQATAEKFAADIKKIEGSVSHLKAHVDATQPKSGGFMSSIMTGVGIGTGIGLFNTAVNTAQAAISGFVDSIKQMDDLGDFAQQIGVTAGELSGLQFAAEQGGSSAEAMDTGLQKLTTRLGEAAQGSAEAQKAFSQIGLNWQQLAQMSPAEALKQIADRFKAMSSPTDQAAAAVDIFGKSGVNLVNVLAQGTAGINQFIEKGKAVGAVMDESMAASADEAQNAISALSASWQGLKNTLSTIVAPVITVIAEGLSAIVGGIRENIKYMGFLGFMLGTWLDQAREQAEAERQLALAAQRRAKAASDAAKAEIAARAELNTKIKKGLEENAKAMEKLADESKRRNDEMLRSGEALAKHLRTPMEEYKDTLKDIADYLRIGAFGKNGEEIAKRAVEEAQEKLSKLQEQADQVAKPMRESHATTAAAVRNTPEGFRMEMESRMAMDRDQLGELKKHTELLGKIAAPGESGYHSGAEITVVESHI